MKKLFAAALLALACLAPASAQQLRTPGVAVSAASGDVSAAQAQASLPGIQNRVTHVCGFVMTGAGATSASVVTITIAGLASGSLTFDFPVVAGVTTNLAMIPVQFNPCLPASAVNTAITVTAPSLGSGNVHAQMTAWGYQVPQ